MPLCFTESDVLEAFKQWKATCGHNACAAAAGKTLEDVRVSGVALKGWMNPTMITQCLTGMKVPFRSWKVPVDARIHPFAHMIFEKGPVLPRIFRVQFEGPWMSMPPRFQYRYTHYITSLEEGVVEPMWQPWHPLPHHEWLEFADQYPQFIKRCTGYHFTHVWEILSPTPSNPAPSAASPSS